jgi:hypothetical protein
MPPNELAWWLEDKDAPAIVQYVYEWYRLNAGTVRRFRYLRGRGRIYDPAPEMLYRRIGNWSSR